MYAPSHARAFPSISTATPLPVPPAAAVDGLALQGATMRFARNAEIYGESEPAEFVYRVVSGAVRITKLLSDGRRQISAFHFAGELFGFEAGEDHAFSAEAIIPCEIMVVRREAALGLAERDGEFGRALWFATLKNLERAQEHMILLGRKTAAEKVATFLLDMAKRTGNGPAVELPMSRYDIADYLGLTIETVSRTLSELESSGTIALRSARRLELSRKAALERMDA